MSDVHKNTEGDYQGHERGNPKALVDPEVHKFDRHSGANFWGPYNKDPPI